jgi:hypothetical protein
MGGIIVTGVTFGVFMTEALIHYNMGKAQNEEEFRFELPPPQELVKIAAVTGVFSLLSGVLIGVLQNRVSPKA